MRTISARKFRLAFPTLTEPVTVLLSKDGTFRELGTWMPAGSVDPKVFYNGPQPQSFVTADGTQGMRRGVSAPVTFSPAPKPSAKAKR